MTLTGLLLSALLLLMPASGAQATDRLGSVEATLDRSADPCVDFYQYACGGWLGSQTLEADEASRSRGFSAADDDVRAKLLIILQAAAAQPNASGDAGQLGRFFAACMDEARIENNGISALRPYLAAIDSIDSVDAFLRVAASLDNIGVASLFDLQIFADLRDSRFYSVALDPGALSFPDGDVFRRNDKTSRTLRALTQTHIASVLTELGEPTASAARNARLILGLERIKATFDPNYATSSVFTVASYLEDLSPNLPWSTYFQNLSVQRLQDFFVNPRFIKAYGARLRRLPVATLKAYLRWSLIRAHAPYLPARYQPGTARATLFNLGPRTRWAKCVDDTSEILGSLIGKALQAEDALAGNSIAAQPIFDQVRQTYRERVASRPWLDAASRAATQAKLDGLIAFLGYPATWPDVSSVTIAANDYVGGVIAAKQLAFRTILETYGTSVDRRAWNGTSEPQTVNALYVPTQNQAYLLAGILRAPFFDSAASLALNFGGIGMVGAHELSHGLGPQGRFFDGAGQFQRAGIWTRPTVRNFTRETKCLVAQYGRYAKSTGKRIDGKRTLEENQADINGLQVAFQSFQTARQTQPIGPPVAGLSPEQTFFVGFAQNFCQLQRPEWSQYLDSRTWYRYSPNRYRVNGPVSNNTDFAAAFACPAGAPMNPAKKCEIW